MRHRDIQDAHHSMARDNMGIGGFVTGLSGYGACLSMRPFLLDCQCLEHGQDVQSCLCMVTTLSIKSAGLCTRMDTHGHTPSEIDLPCVIRDTSTQERWRSYLKDGCVTNDCQLSSWLQGVRRNHQQKIPSLSQSEYGESRRLEPHPRCEAQNKIYLLDSFHRVCSVHRQPRGAIQGRIAERAGMGSGSGSE